ncbi:hypothetical protein GOY49_011410 [Klebsiella pneumoniae]|uniref:hypothetical protein n=1 Tax=Klebsiella pneumoniae TaxID=573 RepID=UPI001CC16587|nr:hypothetical protein [Klebsiella pneumoniae]MBZ1584623.1 hypothetical protein [Klebsiella pneumoniae]MCI7885118.1 hypothetical protein [Klebsiella pneumoniae]HDS9329492.1 hypothetical protein [Klebsiella pneumoniae subsp. pneumoniae]
MDNLYTPAEYFMFVEKFDHYFPRGINFMSLLSQFNFKLEEIVVFHRFTLATFNNNKKVIADRHNEFRQLDEDEMIKLSPDEFELYQLRFMRHMEYINHQDDINNKASYIANDSVVINTWAMNEQYMSRGLAQLISIKENKDINTIKPPHTWDKIKDKFLNYGIDFETLPSYDDFNECRVLNNKIKHLNTVDSALESFPSFSGKLNETLSGMKFPLQKYILASHHFIGMLLEEASIK